jgi:outer membrane receptor for ferrienterochelin and colicins
MSARLGRYVAVALGLSVAAPARAEDTEELQSLLSENVITTASATAQKASTAPAISTIIRADELRLYGIRSLAEAINFLSVGVITADPLRTPDIGSRGVLLPSDDGKHFLLLVNGHAVNDPLYGAARFDQGAGIPLDLVDYFEVIVGPGSVLYGSNAMLGVINVITKDARSYRGGHVFGDYEPGRTWNAGAGAGFTFDLFGKPAELSAGVSYFSRFGPNVDFDERAFPPDLGTGRLITYRRGGPADGIWGGTASQAYFTQAPSGMLRLRVGDFEISLMGAAYRRGIPYTTAGIEVDFDDPESRELERSLRLDIKHEATLSSLLELHSRVYGDAFDYQRWVNRNALHGCFRGDFTTCQYYDAGVARWIGIEERLSFNWLQDLSLVTLVGVDARQRWVSAKQDALDFDTGRPFLPTAGRIADGTAESAVISPYVQQTWSPRRWLDMNVGARLDIDARFSPVLSPRGALALTPFEKTTFRAVYSEAFRAPTWSETDLANYHVAPSDDVKPEKVRSIEGSIQQRFGTQRILFGVFRTWWDNLVVAHALSGTEMEELQRRGLLPITATGLVQFRNEATIENYGWNAAWDGTLAEGRLTYGATATAAYTRRSGAEAGDQLLPASPQFFGNARLAYVFGGYVPTPALAAYYVGRRLGDRGLDPDFRPRPYAARLAEFRFTLSGVLPAVSGLSYRLSAAYTTAAESAYVVGPTPGFVFTEGPASFAPVDQFRVFVGLRYDFLTGTSAEDTGEAR